MKFLNHVGQFVDKQIRKIKSRVFKNKCISDHYPLILTAPFISEAEESFCSNRDMSLLV